MLNLKVFSEGLSMIAEMYDKTPSENLLKLYYTVLQDLSDEEFKSAINSIARTNKYNCMPKPAEILEQVHGTAQDSTLNAWAYVHSAIGQVGAYKSPIFEDGAIARTIEHLGGWASLCDTHTDDLKWVQKEFEKFYPIFKKRGGADNVKLLGLAEAHNTQHRLENFDEEKIYIGTVNSSLKGIERKEENLGMVRYLEDPRDKEGEGWKNGTK